MNLMNRLLLIRKIKLSACLLTLIILGSHHHLYAAGEDSLSLSLQQADQLFLKHNFALLAEKFQVNADAALVRQARLWDNPSFSTELGMNSISRPKLLDVGKNGQVAYSVDQVIKIGGQRSKNVQLAQISARYSQAGFDALLNSLKLVLHNTFFELYYKQKTLDVLTRQVRLLSDIIGAYQHADSSGSVAHADFIRLQALQMSLKNEHLNTIKAVYSAQQDLQQLLGTEATLRPFMAAGELANYQLSKYQLADLIDSAMIHRPDLKLAELGAEGSGMNLAVQKSLAVPDLHVGLVYDKQGSYINNYWGLSLGIDLPFWNRNQGNIKSAEFMVLKGDTEKAASKNRTYTEVQSAYGKLQALEAGFQKSALQSFHYSYEQLMAEVARNFARGNISLLQFIDYFNSYSDNIQDQNSYYTSLYEAYETLSYAVGVELFR